MIMTSPRFPTTYSLAVWAFFLLMSSLTTLNAQGLQAPADLHFLRVGAQLSNVTLFWTDQSDAESGFVIEQQADNGAWALLQQVEANTTSHSINGIDPRQSVSYRVKAINGGTSSSYSATVRLVGSDSPLEVYPEVPGIRNPRDTTVNGMTFSMMQDQCAAEPSKGKATRISTFYEVTVRSVSDTKALSSPVYETRPQIRNQLTQNNPENSGGHRPYGYHGYGPNSNQPQKRMHTRHWTNFDAQEDVVLRIKLLPGANFSGPINMNDLDIQPAPLSVTSLSDSELELTLPGAPAFARHYRVTMNRTAWAAQGGRGENSYEAPLLIFINPIHIAPASAPQGQIKEFYNGALLVMGAGIHLPDHHYQFFGQGENDKLRELYAPGDAYLHGGFLFNNDGYAIKVWGRAMYSDEMFEVYLKESGFSWSNPTRTPWSTVDCMEGNSWNLNPTWEAHAGFYNQGGLPSVFEGFTNIGARMGPFNQDGNVRMISTKDVGYGGGTYQANESSKTFYEGCFMANDDDITYAHQEYQMLHCTSYNLRNGPSFQYGWGIKDAYAAPVYVKGHVALASDRPNGNGMGKNHGVFNTRLKIGQLEYHNGGVWEDFEVFGQESIVFQLRLWDEGDNGSNTSSLFEDKVYKNFTIHEHSRNDNLIWGDQSSARNVKSYFRFLHFDNLIIEGNHVESIDDGDFFDYNEAALLHTITFFSLPDPVTEPDR